MATTILVIGESGTGKSTSIRTLDPKETMIINVLNKPLPFRGWRNNYKRKTVDTEGNIYSSNDSANIITAIRIVDERDHVKCLVIDDFQHVMCNEFMIRALEKGFDKFTEIGQHAYNVINAARNCRESLNVFFLSHSEIDEHGRTKCMTVGKIVDKYAKIEGWVTIVLSTIVKDDDYFFQTRTDGLIMAKSPMGMFEDKYIPNDLQLVNEAINNYDNYEVEK